MASESQDSGTRIEIEGETELLKTLSTNESAPGRVCDCLTQFQTACRKIIHHQLETSAGPVTLGVETRIWDAHLRINSQFRKLLSPFHDEQVRKKRPVEDRRLKHHYQKFIRGSQNLYEGYLQIIIRRFGSMPELGEAAEELRINSSRAAVVNAAEIPQELRKAIIDSCYSSLIRLGDLYRYFQTGLVSSPKRREWDRVATYYRLAGSIKPYKGASYHQLSIISLAKADHLEATYCLYRALCAMDPLPTADGNLQIELRKVLKEWNSGKLTENKSELELSIAHFMYLHAMCYKGVKFAEHDEAENKLLDKLAAEIARGSLESNLLQKLCLVNIAAEAHARTKPETNGNAPAFFHRLNVKTFSMLLRVFLSEEDSSTRSFHNILPALRIYSSWLVINSIYLTDESEDCLLDARIKELWELYASFLTRLSSTFDVQNIPYLNYLLPEDLDTLGFFPLMHNGKSRRHVDENGNAKSRAPEHNSEEDQKAEMQFRIRELVVDGLDLVDRKKIPIQLVHVDNGVVFRLGGDDEPLFSSGKSTSRMGAAQDDIVPQYQDDCSEADGLPAFDKMNYMVNQIVDPENGSNENFTNGNFTIKLKPWPPPIKTDGGLPLETTEWPHTPIAKPEPTQSYSPVPPLPSIMNSPFAPAPVQSPSPSLLLGSPGSRPSTANRTAMHRSSGSDDISAARSHYSTFQQSNLCSASMVSTNPTPTQASSVYQDHWQVARSFTLDYTSFPYAYNQRLGSSPLTSSVYSPCSLNGTSFATSSVRPFRVVGQTPPSGQGG